MKNGRVVIDSFSGAAADLSPGNHTPADVLEALRTCPQVSSWDMGEHAWLRNCIDILKREGKITEVRSEPYPWHRYEVCAKQEGQS